MKFHAKLNSNQHVQQNTTSNANASAALDKYINYEYDEHDYSITFIIHLPIEGQYGLDLYARDPEYQTEKRTMSHCCKYIVNYSKSSASDSSAAVNDNQVYSFDSPRSSRQQKETSSSRANPLEQSLSPRKSHLHQIS